MQGRMHVRVLAARFATAEEADVAVTRLRRELDLGPDDVGLAPLGGADQPAGDAVVLAGRFREARVALVREVIAGAGGVMVADVDEGWTKPRTRSPNRSTTWRSEGWQRNHGGSWG